MNSVQQRVIGETRAFLKKKTWRAGTEALFSQEKRVSYWPTQITGGTMQREWAQALLVCTQWQEEMGTNWNMWGFLWTSKKTFLLWGWSHTNTGCHKGDGVWNGLGLQVALFKQQACIRYLPEVPSNSYHSLILWNAGENKQKNLFTKVKSYLKKIKCNLWKPV